MTVQSKLSGAPSRDALHAFYDAYFETLDEGRLEEWPDFFVEDCLYRIIPRENYEAGQGICVMQGDSKNMLIDRVRAILDAGFCAALLPAVLLRPAAGQPDGWGIGDKAEPAGHPYPGQPALQDPGKLRRA